MNDFLSNGQPRKGKFSSLRKAAAKKFSVVRPLSEKNTPKNSAKTSIWGSKQVSRLKAVITGKPLATKPDKNETPEAAKPKDVKAKSQRRGKGGRNRSYRQSKRNRKSRRKAKRGSEESGVKVETPKAHPVEKPPMPKEEAVEVRPERVMSVTAVLGGRPRTLSNESEFSRITNKSFRDTVVGETLLEERRTWGSINEDWEEDLPPQAVAEMPVITPTESMLLPTFKPFSSTDRGQSAPQSMTDVSSYSSVSTTGAVASPTPTAPAVEPNQQAMMHLIPDMMVLPSEPIHGQRMMVPAVYDANHRCFVVSVNQSVNTQPVMAPGYQFVYPAVQVAPPAPWMYPQMMNSQGLYGQFSQMEG
jgi:hypothetical protein